MLTKLLHKLNKTWYNKQISVSYNKTKTIWNFLKTETKRKGKTGFLFSSVYEESCGYQDISDSFNKYFLSIANKINLNIKIVIIIINIKIRITYIIYHNCLVIYYQI